MTSCVLAAVFVLGLAAQEPFHARRLGGQPSPPATLADIAWLEGRWVGEGLGGISEEQWSPARGGVMMGMYRLLKDGKPVFYEFLMLAEENGTLAMKLKHFNPDFSGWEEKSGFVTFKLVAVEGRAVHFDGLSFFREGEDELRIFLLLRDKDGTVREELFKMRRVRTNP
jgi:Domain of unknown function (DUF6265)